MLGEIGRIALAVGREMYGEDGGGPLAVESGETPGALSGRERLAFLAAHLSAIERAVERVATAPRAALRLEPRAVVPERVQRPAPHALTEALRRGDLRPCAPSSPHSCIPPLASRLGGYMPRTLTENAPTSTTDTPENRYVAGLLAGWRRDLRTIAAFAEWEQDEAARVQALHLEARLKAVESRKSRVESREPDTLSTLDGRLVTDALLRDPRYRVLHDLDRRYRRLLRYAWDAPSLILSPKEPWLLYEMWCFFSVVRALREAGLRTVGGDAVRLTHGRLTLALAKGQASKLVFRIDRNTGTPEHRNTLSLYYNRAFPSAVVGSREAASRTHTMIPDICLERAGRFLLLDPKFRPYDLPGEEQEDIVKMHAYRDAIHKDGRPIVDGAWCLYPGRKQGSPDIIAYPVSASEEPFGRAGVGAIRLRPGGGKSLLVRLIVEWLAA